MCIAMLTKAGVRVSDNMLSRAVQQNGDGSGFAYIKDGRVEIEKGFMTEKATLERYNRLIDDGFNINPMLIHVRIATTGKIGRDNCHPFPVDRGHGKGAMVHNGSFYSGPRNAEKSDTRVLAERQRNNLTYEVVKEAIDDIGHEVGSYNKMIFLYDNANYVIINEQEGTWYDDAIWVSNKYFRPEPISNRFNNGGMRTNVAGYCGMRDV